MKRLSTRRLLNVVLLIALIPLFATCKKDDPIPAPVALFSYSPTTNLVAPVTVDFTNQSTNANSYLWTYGSGLSDTDKDLSLTFRAGGTYTISLRATGDGGTDTYSRTITIADPPKAKTTASFTYSPNQNLVAPAKITFTNTSSNADSYKWDFGDGTTSTTTSLTKDFTKAGTYQVKLTATGATGANDFTANITINPPTAVPTADFTYSPSSNLTAPARISFTNTSRNASSYAWDFGDGTTSTTTNPIKDFTKAGDYTVKLTATDAQNQKAQKTAVISVKAATVASPVADWSWSASNLKVTFTNQSKNATSYSWNFNDGTTSTATNPVRDYAKAGTYTVTLTASDGKTQNQNLKLVTISGPTVASCDWNSATKCVTVTKAVIGTRCGTKNSVDVEWKNSCTSNIKVVVCIQRADGTWYCSPDGTFDTGMKPNQVISNYLCAGTGKYKIYAMPIADFIKNKCSYPKE